jgi:hypothetical protein
MKKISINGIQYCQGLWPCVRKKPGLFKKPRFPGCVVYELFDFIIIHYLFVGLSIMRLIQWQKGICLP